MLTDLQRLGIVERTSTPEEGTVTPQDMQRWTNTWEAYVDMLMDTYTREDRLAFLVTLRQIRALPEAGR